MSPLEMLRACGAAIEAQGKAGIPAGKAEVMLTTPRGWRPPPDFPRGTLACITSEGASVRHYPAMRVAAWVATIARAAQSAAEGEAVAP